MTRRRPPIRTRLASLNARGGGRRLGPPADRVTTAVKAWNREGVTLAALNELALEQGDRIRSRHPRWTLVVADETRRTSTAIAWRRDVWREVWRDEIVVDGGRKRPVLSYPVIGLRHVDDPGDEPTVVAVAVHLPPGRGPGARRLRRRIEATVEARLAEFGTLRPVVLLGDTNDSSEPLFETWHGYRLTVDRVLVKGGAAWMDRPAWRREWGGRVTDHQGSPSARLTIPASAPARR